MPVLTPHDAAAALDLIGGRLWKLRSWLFLMAKRFRVLRGIVIYGDSTSDLPAVRKFCRQVGAANLLVRTDRENETGIYPRGGYLVPLEEVERLLRDRPRDRYYFLLEPVHPLQDLYSINSAIWPSDSFVIHEIVGPGFDSSDLKRGGESPHERFLVARKREIGPQDVIDHTVVTPEAFANSWRRRMAKAHDLLIHGTPVRQDFQVEATRRALRDAGLPLLLTAEDGYQRMGFERLQEVHHSLMRLCSILPENEFPGEPLVLSSAFVADQRQLLHWDVVWPQLKYEGLAR